MDKSIKIGLRAINRRQNGCKTFARNDVREWLYMKKLLFINDLAIMEL